MSLRRGQVIVMRRNGTGMVWSSDESGTLIVPFGGYNGPPPHRAEIRIENPLEHLACGFSFRFPVARCHLLFRVRSGEMGPVQVVGTVPTGLLSRIVHAVLREARTQADENRLLLRPEASPAFVVVAA